MLGIVLALLSAIISALGIVLVGRRIRQSNPLNASIIITATGLILLLPLSAVLTDFSDANSWAIVLFALSGVLTPGLTRILYYTGLKKLGSSVNSSVFSFYPIYGAFLAALFLNEALTAGNWIGIGAIVSGGIIIEMSCKGGTCANSTLSDWSFPIIAGIAYALSAVITKTALNIFNAPILGVTIAYTFAFLPYIIILLANEKSRNAFPIRKNLSYFWIAGVALAASWILAFVALSLASVTIVIPLHSTEPLFIVLFSFFYLKQQEQLSLKLISGILLAVLGVVLVII